MMRVKIKEDFLALKSALVPFYRGDTGFILSSCQEAGKVKEMPVMFVGDYRYKVFENKNGIGWWIDKHVCEVILYDEL